MDHYKTLGVGRNASPEKIEIQYKELMAEYSKPHWSGSQYAVSMRQDIQTAYDILRDPNLRNEYNREYDSTPHTPARPKKGPTVWLIFMLIIVLGGIATGILYSLIPELFSAGPAPAASASPADTPWSIITGGAKEYRASDGAFGGTFSGTTPEETKLACRIDIYDVNLAVLSNHTQYIGYADYTPYRGWTEGPSGKKVKADLDGQAINFVKAQFSQDAKITSSKKITGINKKGNKAEGLEYRMRLTYQGKDMDLYGRTYFEGDNTATWFTLCHMLYLCEAGSDSAKDAKAFFDTCFFF